MVRKEQEQALKKLNDEQKAAEEAAAKLAAEKEIERVRQDEILRKAEADRLAGEKTEAER